MSWLSEIAGKAEALLDRMDQAAATSIQSSGLTTPHTRTVVGQETQALTYEPTASVGVEKTHSLPPNSPRSSLPPHKQVAIYSPVAHPEPPPKTPPTPSSYTTFSKSKSSVPNDDSIFEFLNTPTRPEAKKPHVPKNLNKRNLTTASSQNVNRSDSLARGRPLGGVEGEKERGHGEGDKHEEVEEEGRMRDRNQKGGKKDVLKKSQVIDDTDNNTAGEKDSSPKAVGSGEMPLDPPKSGRLSVDSVKSGSDVIVQQQPTLGEGEKAPGSSDLSEQKVVSCCYCAFTCV